MMNINLNKQILNDICIFLSKNKDINPNELVHDIYNEFEVDLTLQYYNHIYNSYNNNYYYYEIGRTSLYLYIYYRNAKIEYAEIRDSKSHRKICETGK